MLLDKNEVATYKPFSYPWAYDYWHKQQKMHWLPEEVSLGPDIMDWKTRLTPEERNLLTQIFRFFTQADIEVANCYHKKYMSVFHTTEVQMMLSAFSNMETIHIAAYAHLLDTIGMPETEYLQFMKYAAMRDKAEYGKRFSTDTPYNTALTLAAFGGFIEGMQLFASFAMLLNFPRHGKMIGMGQIISWSIRDESLHVEGIIALYHQLVKEYKLDQQQLEFDIIEIVNEMIHHEDKFIELAFEMGPVEGLTADEVRRFIRRIANHRLSQLGISPQRYARSIQGSGGGMYSEDEIASSLPWFETMVHGADHTNFFENRVTNYSKGSTTGTWEEVFES